MVILLPQSSMFGITGKSHHAHTAFMYVFGKEKEMGLAHIVVREYKRNLRSRGP